MRRRALPVAAWLALLGACGWWLLEVGGAGLAGPDLRRPGTWAAWAESRAPLDAAFALLRLAALGAVGYLVVVTVLGVVVRLVGSERWARRADRFSIGVVRRVLDGAVGLGFTASALGLAAVPVAVRAVPPGTPPAELAAGAATLRATTDASWATMAVVADGAATTADMVAVPTDGGIGPAAEATMVAVPADDAGPPPATATAATVPAAAPPPEATATPPEACDPPLPGPGQPAPTDEAAAAEAPGPDVPTGPATWTVGPGDHLWGIAEQALPAGADEGEVAAYWARLVALNRDSLADPDCPDLLFVGQVVELPDH